MLLQVIYSNEHWYCDIVDTVFMPRPRRHDLCNIPAMTKTKQLLHCIKQNNTRELKCEAQPELGMSII